MVENAQPIDVVVQPSPEEFRERFVRAERPAIVRGALGAWLPTHKWTLEYLRSIYGERLVKVASSKTGEYFNYDTRLQLGVDHPIQFSRFLDGVFEPRAGDPKLHLNQEALDTWEILRDESPPIRFIPRPVVAKNIWIGSDGNITKVHYDTEDNINVQVKGRKEFILFPSSQLDALYPLPPWEYKSNFSRVELQSADLRRFPRFKEATPFRGVTEPGDFIYIPIYWWHQVHTLEAGINVNFWWQASALQALRRNGTRYWPRIARDGYLLRHLSQTLGRTIASRRARR